MQLWLLSWLMWRASWLRYVLQDYLLCIWREDGNVKGYTVWSLTVVLMKDSSSVAFRATKTWGGGVQTQNINTTGSRYSFWRSIPASIGLIIDFKFSLQHFTQTFVIQRVELSKNILFLWRCVSPLTPAVLFLCHVTVHCSLRLRARKIDFSL